MSSLVLRGTESLGIDIATSAVEHRDSSLVLTRALTYVTQAAEAKVVVDAIRDLRAIQKAVETDRTDVKRPILELGRKIDTVAKEFVGPIDAEVNRLQILLSKYQSELARLAKEEEAKRQAEIQAAREAEAKARQEAEAARLKAEREAADIAAKAATEDADPFAAAESQAAAKRAAEIGMEKARAAAEAARQAIAAAAAAPSVIAPAPAGMTVRREPNFEVTDALKLANARPDLVTITPKAREILVELRRLKEWEGKRAIIHGSILAWWDGKVVVR